MAKTVIISTSELIAFIESVLYPFIGVAAMVADHRPILEQILDAHFSPEIHEGSSRVRESLREYRVPSDIASELESELRNGVIQQVTTHLGQPKEECDYHYRITGFGDLYVTETLARPSSQPTLADLYAQEVAEDLADGGWYPERIRRIVGVS